MDKLMVLLSLFSAVFAMEPNKKPIHNCSNVQQANLEAFLLYRCYNLGEFFDDHPDLKVGAGSLTRVLAHACSKVFHNKTNTIKSILNYGKNHNITLVNEELFKIEPFRLKDVFEYADVHVLSFSESDLQTILLKEIDGSTLGRVFDYFNKNNIKLSQEILEKIILKAEDCMTLNYMYDYCDKQNISLSLENVLTILSKDKTLYLLSSLLKYCAENHLILDNDLLEKLRTENIENLNELKAISNYRTALNL